MKLDIKSNGLIRGNVLQFKSKVFVLLLLIIVASCNQKKVDSNDDVEFRDDLGRMVVCVKNPSRFLSLAPSITELLALFCDTATLVGRTHYCTTPLSLMNKPVVNNYPLDTEKVLWLKPDLVFSVEGMMTLEQANALEALGIPVYFQRYTSVEDILEKALVLARITGNGALGKLKIDSIRRELIVLSNKKTLSRPTVLTVLSSEPLFVCGKESYFSDILAYAGAENVLVSSLGNAYPMVSEEYILALNPEVIIAGNDVSLATIFFEQHPALKRTKAYKTGMYFSIDDDYISRPGPRVVDAVKALQSIFNNKKVL